MKYEVGQILYAIDPCVMKSDGRTTLTVGKGYEIIGNDAIYKELTVIDDEKSDHSFGYDEAAKYFTAEKLLNGGTINTKDHRLQDPIPDTGKYSPEQIAFLEEHAKAAMQGLLSNSCVQMQDSDLIVQSYNFAEAMLQERIKRLEK